MTPETPLTEVARFLPVDAARVLSECDYTIQAHVLGQMRAILIYWEGRGIALDPVAMEAAINAVVASTAPLVECLLAAITVNEQLTSQLAAADTLTNSTERGPNV